MKLISPRGGRFSGDALDKHIDRIRMHTGHVDTTESRSTASLERILSQQILDHRKLVAEQVLHT